MRALLFALLVSLAACSTEEAPREAPPRVGDVAGPEAEPSVVSGPNEALRIEPDEVGVVTVSDAAGAYDVMVAAADADATAPPPALASAGVVYVT